MKKNKLHFVVSLILAGAVNTSCGWSNAAKGGVIGAGAGGAVGAGVGAAAGGKKGAAIGAIIGAAVGGTTGVVIGHHMDKEAEEMRRDLEDAKVERVGEGILVTFNSGILFDVGKADLKEAARTNITNLAGTLDRYQDTDVVIAGHTDSTGGHDLNMELSKRRAEAVASFAESKGIDKVRLKIVGEGEMAPVASNDDDEGRAANRRVEIAIFASEKMKKMAEEQGKL